MISVRPQKKENQIDLLSLCSCWESFYLLISGQCFYFIDTDSQLFLHFVSPSSFSNTVRQRKHSLSAPLMFFAFQLQRNPSPNYLFHQILCRKINQIKCLIEAGPAGFSIHAASVWLLLRNQEVLILTALRHPPFKDRDRKMNLWRGGYLP